MFNPPTEVTTLLLSWSEGDPVAFERLMPLVFEELRRIAQRYFAGEPVDHTLQPTALVNEVYLKMVDQRHVQWQNRAQFFARGAELRLVGPDGSPGHARSFLGPEAYAPVPAKVLRKGDGTGFVLLPDGDAGAGPLRLTLTYHRERTEAGRPFRQAGDKRPERVMIDIP